MRWTMPRRQEALLDQLIAVAGGDSDMVLRALREAQGATPPTARDVIRRIVKIKMEGQTDE